MSTNIRFRTMTGERVNKRMLIPVLVWVAVYIASLIIIKNAVLPETAAIIISLLPPAVFIWVMISFIINVSLMDELKRRMYLEASAIAFSLSLILIMTLGTLSMVITIDSNDWDYRHIMPYMIISFFIGLAITKKKYL